MTDNKPTGETMEEGSTVPPSSEYPSTQVSKAFFGGKDVAPGDKKTVSVVSVEGDTVEIRCDHSDETPKGSDAMAAEYDQPLAE